MSSDDDDGGGAVAVGFLSGIALTVLAGTTEQLGV